MAARYLDLARELVQEIESGVLKPGTKLPGTRTLAERLGLSRNTILAAYRELVVQGWAETNPAMGTFVRRALEREPGTRTRPATAARMREEAGFALGRSSRQVSESRPGRAMRDFSSGVPDTRLVPTELIARSYRRVLRRSGSRLLAYGDPQGEESLRRELATMLAETRGLDARPENILVTRGAQMGLSLLGQFLFARGDRVAVEEFGYAPAWRTFERAGARPSPLPVDEQGMVVDRLERKKTPRAVYVTPHHQFPTMALLAPERRRFLLDWAARRRVPLIEDDYDHEFQFEGRPILPLASADQAGVVLYVGGFSKVLAPALRLGYVVAPAEVIVRLVELRNTWDRQGDRLIETTVAELLGLGEIQRHIRKARRCYESRRLHLAERLASKLGGCLDFRTSPGGLSIWARVVDGSDIPRWQEAARKRGLLFRRAAEYHLREQELPFIRLSFASMTESELDAAVDDLVRARPQGVHRS